MLCTDRVSPQQHRLTRSPRQITALRWEDEEDSEEIEEAAEDSYSAADSEEALAEVMEEGVDFNQEEASEVVIEAEVSVGREEVTAAVIEVDSIVAVVVVDSSSVVDSVVAIEVDSVSAHSINQSILFVTHVFRVLL